MSEPISGEKFFGREEVLELLTKRASALKDGYRQNVAFTGQSLAGKTSILHHFLYTIRDEEYIAIYIEIVKEPFRSFANRFIATLLYNVLSKIGNIVPADMEALMEKSRALLPRTHQAIRSINSCVDKGDTDEAYSCLLGLTSIVKEEIKMPCIVMLDEFDNLEWLGVKNPFLNFGKMIMVQKDTMYIVTSSRNQAIKKILSEKLSLLFGNFEIVKISGFSPKSADDFINTRLEGYEISCDMRRFIIAFSEGNPFYLNRLVKSSRSIAAARMSNYIDNDVVTHAVLDEIYSSDGAIYQYLLNFILDLIDTRYRDKDIGILTSIASGKKKQQDIARSLRAKPSDVSKCLTRLGELGFISKNGIFHKIDDGLLEFWLKYVYQRKKEILVDDIFNKARLFEEEFGSYLRSCIDELNKDVRDKMVELFNLFSNELVPIDSKYTRLPHFTRVEMKAFGGSRPFLAATFRGKSWIVMPYENWVDENDIIDYMRSVKTSGYKVSNKLVMPLSGIDENAKLLAKELKISIWDLPVINMLLALYGKRRLVVL